LIQIQQESAQGLTLGDPERRRRTTRAWYASVAYAITSLVATWPLVRGLGRDVPWDLGDSILNMWILSWDCEQLRHILGGDFSKIATFFDANIFYPAPLTLAYSEHLIPQAIQIFPLYLLSGNPILCYNVLFLSSIVLAGLGMYLLVRELTGNELAAFVAGLLFAFAPYRLPQSGHLQVLTSQWMPFVLYGLLRYFKTRRLVPLLGAATALTAQNLSSGYYLLFFMPFAVVFALWQIGRLGLWRDRRAWAELCGAGLLLAATTTPFLLPYASLRGQGFAARSLTEVFRFSADVYSYGTASSEQLLWGRLMQVFPKSEGELFPGIVAVFLAAIGVVIGGCLRAQSNGITDPQPSRSGAPARSLAWLFGVLAIAHVVAAGATLLVRRISFDTGLFVLRMSNVNQLLLRATVAFALLLMVSPASRARTRLFLRERGYFVVVLVSALWLSLGPMPQSLGRPVEIAAPYRVLFDYVPGFDGVRVPARFAMIVAFALAALAGYGAAWLSQARLGRALLVVAAVVAVLEATRLPFIVNGAFALREFNTPEARLFRPGRAPGVYREFARQPWDAVLVELPLGPPDFDLRAMFYSTVHWRRIVNGYSGFYPPHYGRLMTALFEIPRHPEFSIEVLRSTGATHLILHEAAYLNGEGPATTDVLVAAGAVELFRDGSDVLFLLPH
jgi:hypothetical protein